MKKFFFVLAVACCVSVSFGQANTCPTGFFPKSPTITPTTFNPVVNPTANTWAALPDMNIARTVHDVAVVNGKIYAIGGQYTNNNTTDIFDPLANTWSTGAPYPVGTTSSGIMVASVGNKIYTFLAKNTYEYNTDTNVWTKKADNTISRNHGDAVTVDGKIYVIGGMTSKKNQIYDPATDTWSNAADIPTAGFASYGFTYTQAAALGGKIYLVGGVYMDTFQVYNPCTNSWTALPDLTGFGHGTYATDHRYSSHSTVAVNGELYVSGGNILRYNGAPVEVIHRKYNPTTQVWTDLPPLPSPLMHNRGVAIGGKIYAIGGGNNTLSYVPTKKAFVYNAASTQNIDETISTCNCVSTSAACGEGEYYCLSESICKASGQACNITTCNNNNTCETGESCNCADCTNGGTDDADRCGLSNGMQMLCTKDKDNSTTAGGFSSVTAQENFNTVNNKLATYLSQFGNANISAGEFSPVDVELKMTQRDWKDAAGYHDWKDAAGNFIFFTSFTKEEAWTRVKELLSIPSSAQVLWSTSSIKYENDSLGDNERYLYSYVIQQTSGVQKQIFFATEFLPGANGWRKVYFISKDYPLSTTATGTEVCQNFTNPRLFGNPVASYQSPAQFCLEQGFRGTSTIVNDQYMTEWLTMWNATGTGWVPNQNGDRIDEIRCCGIPANATTGTVQVGACCPAGKQWSSVAGACVSPVVGACAEGQYYCHAELKCKAAGAACGTITCNNNNTCDTNESCDCADCNQKADHCGISTGNEQLFCTPDTAQCFTDKFPYCLPACLDGYSMNSTGQCVVGTSTPPVASGPFSCTIRRNLGTEVATVACNTGEVRTGGGCANQGAGGAYRWTNFPIVAGQVPVGYPAVTGTGDGWACATGSTGTHVEAFAVCCTNGGEGTTTIRESSAAVSSQVECSAGETRIGGGCKNTAGGAYMYRNYPISTGDDPLGTDGPTAVHDGWVCLSGSSGNTITAYAICRTSTGTTPLSNVTIKKGLATGEAVSCDAGQKLIGGGYSNNDGGGAYAWVSLPMYTGDSVTNSFWTHLALQDEYFATPGSSGTSLTAYALCADSNSSNVSFQRYDTQSAFTAANTSPIIVSYDSFPNGRFATYEQTFATEGVKIKPNDPGYTTPLWPNDWTTLLPGKELAITGKEGMEFNFTTPVNAFGYDFVERVASIPGYETTFVDSTFVISIYNGATKLTEYTFTPANDVASFFGVSSTQTFDKVIIQETVGSVDDELYGKLYIKRTTTSGTSCQNFTYPTNKANYAYGDASGYVPGDAPGATQFCTANGYTSGTLITAGNLGSVSNIALEVKCCGGNITTTCQNYPNPAIPAIGGGLVIVRPASTAQFCSENGGGDPFMKTWNMVGTVAVWNGTSWYGDSTGGGATSLDCCTLTSAPVTPPTTTPGVPQVGACCPPGSSWSSAENRCIPTTCGEGQFYCAAQKKCLTGGTTCDITVCINDGTCSGDESCQCADCVNGGTDDKDKCSIIGGVQALCSDDNLGDGKPGACCAPPKKWSSQTNTCVECSNTQAPSELKAGLDEPYITCTGSGDTAKTHFRYRITESGGTMPPFISEPFTLGTQVLHTTMTTGTYTVECFYGTAASVDTSPTSAPHSCVKTITVSDTAQGCSRVYPYKGSTLSDEMTSTSAFDASFRCGSRLPMTGTITNPYMFRVGTQPISYLLFDSLISELFNGLAIGPVSTQTQNYTFTNGTTDVSCATKVGGGYSTNSACRLRACAGGDCNTPQTFSVIHSGDLLCTSQDTDVYNIGCNPEASDTVRNQCIAWFRDAVTAGSTMVPDGVEFNIAFVFDNLTPTTVKCTKYDVGRMPGGLNLSDNVVCQALLKNGESYQIYAADTNGRMDALQSTARTVERDREPPTIAEIKYYTDDSLTTEITPSTWYNKPIIALAICSDTPLNESTSCACARTVDASTTDATLWSFGVPNSLIGADLMHYTRTITSSLTGVQTVRIVDTAGNQSGSKNLTASLDTKAPTVAVTESGSGATKTVTLTANDTDSKIWKATSAPTGALNTQGIVYRIGLKTDITTLAFTADCSVTPLYASVAETQAGSFPAQAVATIPNVNTGTQVVTYCIRDNAGNTTRGIYPVTTSACFSSSNMTTIPNLDTYKDLTKTRLDLTTISSNQKYGYTFSENTTDANCFRGILGTNVTTLLANQLTPRTTTTLSNWDLDRAILKNSTTLSSGYYYYSYTSTNTLNITTSPTGTGEKSVVVEGGDIRIKTNIEYTGTDKVLLLIARKNGNGNGGNIIVDPSVTRIDAIIIADGGAFSSSDATLPGERLMINGRLYSYNTRAGSLTVSGADLIDAASPKKFTNSNLVSATSLTDARDEDLERLRPMFTDGTNVCSLHINYQSLTTTSLPALLKRPSSYAGGSCGF